MPAFYYYSLAGKVEELATVNLKKSGFPLFKKGMLQPFAITESYF